MPKVGHNQQVLLLVRKQALIRKPAGGSVAPDAGEETTPGEAGTVSEPHARLLGAEGSLAV